MLTLPQKDKLVQDILSDLTGEILKKVDKWPENWDGHEIRQFIADYYEMHYIFGTSLKGKRKAEYKNTCLVDNLI
jgi:phage gp37-like protein